jgi:glycosyltransferase involved in cell wall biosynthesis
VLILSPVADLYGSTRSMVETLDLIDPRRLRASWGIPHHGTLAEELSERGVPYTIVPGLQLARTKDSGIVRLAKVASRLPPGALRVARLARREGIQLIHSNSATVVAGAYAAPLAGVPHLWYVREMIPERGLLGSILRREIPRRADALLCVSSAVAEQFDRGAVPARVLHSGVDWRRVQRIPTLEARARLGIPAEAAVVGSAGYLNPRKGMDLLLEGYAAARPGLGSTARLLLAGAPYPGNERFAERLSSRARELGLGHELLMTGFLDEIGPFLSALDVFALTTREPEGLGRAVLEAMASGLPVIASGGGGMRDIIEGGRSGLLLDVPTPAAIADALSELLGDRALRERLGEAARAEVRDRFRLDYTAERLLQTYTKLAER